MSHRAQNAAKARDARKTQVEQKKINKARELLSRYPDRYTIEAIEDLEEREEVIEEVDAAKKIVNNAEEVSDSDSDGIDMTEVIAKQILKSMKSKAKKPKKKKKAPVVSESSESSDSDDEITGGHSVKRGKSKVSVNVYNTQTPEKKPARAGGGGSDEVPCRLKF